MNERIINTLTKICEDNKEYAILYIPAHDRISLVYTPNLDVEILYIEMVSNTEYKFESDYDEIEDTNMEYILLSVYNTLIKIKLESLIEDLDITNVNDFNDIITIVNNIREKYC